MGFSYNKAMLLRPQKGKGLSTFLFAFLISAAVLTPYIVSEVEFFAAGAELGSQQLGAFFLTSQDLGDYYFPIIGSLGMVIGAPVALLVQLIPSGILPYISGGVMALRIALAALTSYFFIRRFTRTPAAARLGAFLYAFSSAVIGITVNNAFQNAVVVFPLLLLAAEKLLTENRRMWLAITVFCAAIISGYALFNMLIFLIVYIVLRMTNRDTKVDFLRVFAVFFEIIAGALSAAILLVPIAVISVLSTFDFTGYIGMDALFYESGQMYLSLLRSFLMPAESVNNAVMVNELTASKGLFGAYLPLVSLSGVIAFCGAKKYSSFKRIVIASVVISAIPVLNNLFSVANPAVGYMWFYMPTLIFALVSVMALENRDIAFTSGIKWSAALTVILSLIVLAFPQMGENGLIIGLYNGALSKAGLIRMGIYGGVALIGIIILAVILKAADSRDKTMFNTLALSTGVLSAVTLWLYIATEVTFFKKSLLSSVSGTNADLLSLEKVSPDKLVYYSMLVSIAALGAMLVYLIICIATRKKRREAECEYPEGEELIEIWQRYDEEESDGYLDDDESEFSLDSIAESLQMEYPVNYDPDEFKGGFNIVTDISAENGKTPIDSEQ